MQRSTMQGVSGVRRAYTLVDAAAVVVCAGVLACVFVACNRDEPKKPEPAKPAPANTDTPKPAASGDAKPGPSATKPSAPAASDPLTAARRTARKVKDAANVRSIQQSCVIWAQSNRENYPRPSQIDRNNFTVAGPAVGTKAEEEWAVKDNTGNIISMMIYNGNIATDTVISPGETNPAVKNHEGYAFTNPAKAVNRANALWDPSFAGTAIDPTSGPGVPVGGRGAAGVSHNSFAQMALGGARNDKWRDTLSATDAVWANRGPRYAGTDTSDVAPYAANGWKLIADPAAEGTGSNTLHFFGKDDKWSGNIAWSDNHVTFDSRPDPVETTYRRIGTTQPLVVPDNLFVDESDDSTGGKDGSNAATRNNNYMRPVASMSVTVKDKVTTINRVVWRD